MEKVSLVIQEYRRKCIPGDASPFKEMMKTIINGEGITCYSGIQEEMYSW